MGLLPTVMLATVFVIRVAMAVDPPSNPQTAPTVVLTTTGFLGGVHVLVLAWNAGYAVPLDGLLVGALVFGASLVGYSLWRDSLSFT